MARRRKSEMKSSVKSSIKYVPVRKSSRRIAKKQSEEKKVNGDILQISYLNNSEDGRNSTEYPNQVLSKKNQNSVRKHNKHKNGSNSNVVAINEDYTYSTTSQYKKDSSESDSQDGVDIIIERSAELSPEDVQQVVVGNPSREIVAESVSTEIEIWPEDVIEETIICEEMEVKDDVKDSDCSSKQEEDNRSVRKEVLLVNDASLEKKTFSEYTVIQNENNMASMLIECDSKDTSNDECCCAERNEMCPLHISKTDNSISALCTEVPIACNDKNDEYTRNNKSILNNRDELQVNKSSRSVKKLHDGLSKDDTFSKIDNKLAEMRINESSKEIEKLVNDLSSMENIMSPLQITDNVVEKVIPMSVDDESSCSILDKMEQLHRSNNSASLLDDTEKNKPDSCNDKAECANRNVLKLKVGLQDKKSEKIQRKATNSQQASEEYGDSEADSKLDGEDTKLSSSSDNSNDTLLSMNNCKLTELDPKCNNGSSNDIDKRNEFRSRSGSTDTTGSESGSNSSGVRRSSRIRSIGLMKQRSRGRGLVTKPNIIDISKPIVQPEREKIVNNNCSIINEAKIENPIEPQSDKESNAVKTTNTFESVASLATSCAATGYDSDSSKPVKVKSRWRRSSELEMGGSNAGSVSALTIGSLLPIAATTNTSEAGSFSTVPKFTTGPVITDTTSCTDSGSGSASATAIAQFNADTEQTRETAMITNTVNVVQIPKTVGAKISLSMVPEIKDREMEERLSQFEYLRENLYLTERYTNKETKRMVCDCFLTDEEIERGELGCGEDCLNRLLMIECGPRCIVGDRCTNKRFQNCAYAKCEVFRTEKKGFGLRAMIDMLAGEFIMEYVGEVVDPKDFRRRAKEYSKDKNKHYYFMALKSDQIIDATMKGNVSRFINHSCDPNSETQKWTVNGELRIGFFNKKFIAAGEEITFDYHFQRYGKEAQKCFCEAPNCRGWIGETPEEEKEKIEKKEKRDKDMKKKKGEKKQADYMEDEDLEEEIDKLCLGGLKNRAHTLTLSRLMVRSRELEHRTRLLRLIQSGEQPCRRLFLDYHGLRLIWSYVMDVSTNDTDEAQQFRLEVLKTLNTLPIPNKTMLMDSKIYNVIEKWSRRLYFSPNGDSPEDDQGKAKAICEELQINYDANEKKAAYRLTDTEKQENNVENSEIKSEDGDRNLIPELASSLLAEWSNLKEVFRIPKKERIEQMKEHEREADRGYREELEKDEKRGTSYDRHRPDRYGRGETEKRGDRRRGRESPESEHARTKDKRVEERSSLVPIPRMTKYERRQLFAMKVAKEEEERQRRQQQESWQEHETRCLALSIDPHTTAMVDPQTGYPVFYNPSIGQWQQYPTQDSEINQQCTPIYVGAAGGGAGGGTGGGVASVASVAQSVPGHSQTGMVSQNSHVLQPQPSIPAEISSGMSSGIPSGVPPVIYTISQTSVFNQTTTTAYSLLSHCHQQYPDSQLPLPNSIAHSGTTVTIQPPSLYEHTEKQQSDQQFQQSTFKHVPQAQSEVPPIDLPPKWKSAIDARGRTYYYHVKERISQWLPPPPDHIGVQPDSSSTSESSEESSSSNEEEEDIVDEDNNEDTRNDELHLNSTLMETSSNDSKHNACKKSAVQSTGCTGSLPEGKKRREGLVQERIISPRRDEDRMDHKTHKGIKEKLRRQKERAKFKEHVDKMRRHRRNNKSKSHSRHSLTKLQSPSSDLSTMSERKIKDTFRINMANVMVHFLNPYRKNDCKQGRITNTEDFKHLARKLTHFVLAKELKHCKSVDELQCNENVKHKAKDFVRKYMSKFGAVYQKSTDED